MFFNSKKFFISAIDYSTGQAIPTESIALDGHHSVAFKVLQPTVNHKHLGVRMSLTLDFRTESQLKVSQSHVIYEMKSRVNECIRKKC
jgi:hypothetical protein